MFITFVHPIMLLIALICFILAMLKIEFVRWLPGWAGFAVMTLDQLLGLLPGGK